MPSESAMGTIRGDFCIEVGRNICHGSDAVESANKEIAHWFPEGVSEYESCEQAWIYEQEPKGVALIHDFTTEPTGNGSKVTTRAYQLN